jgi:hypothetical protein
VSAASLGRDERRVLATLAVVGQATLSAEELADVTGVHDVAVVLDDLRRRGLVRTDERGRNALLGTVGGEIRESAEALSSAERLRKYFETLARRGRLTPARAAEDAGAILGLSGWLAEHRRWEDVLELVQTTEAGLSIEETVAEWIALLRQGREAARLIGDAGAEAALADRLADAAPEPPPAYRAPPPPRSSGTSGWQVVALTLSLLAATAIGVVVGYLVSSSGGSGTSTTAVVPVTLSLPGQTVVTIQTATLPAETVTETTATTETVVTTVTTP